MGETNYISFRGDSKLNQANAALGDSKLNQADAALKTHKFAWHSVRVDMSRT